MSRLPRNIAYNLLGQLGLLILTLLAARLVFRRLGPDALGVILFAQTLNIILVSVFETGIAATVVREIAACRETDPPYLRDLVRTYSSLYWISYVGLGLGLYLLAPLMARSWINLQSIDVSTTTTVFRILGISALLSLPRSLYAGVLRGTQRMGIKNVIDVGGSAAQQLAILLALTIDSPLTAVAWWMAGAYGLSLLAYATTAGRLLSWDALIPGYLSSVVARTRGFSLRMVAISGLALIHTQADKVVVSKLLPVSVFGYYGLAWSLVSRAGVVATAIGEAALPSLSQRAGRADQAGLLREYRALQELTTAVALPVFATVMFAASPIYASLFNASVARSLLLPTALLCLGSYMNATMTVPYVYSLATGHPWIAARQNFWALLVVVPGTILLTMWFGLPGAAASWVLYHVAAYAYGVPRFCRVIGIGWASWYGQVGRVAGAAVATFGIGWVIAWVAGASLAGLIAAYLAGGLGFALATYRMAGPELRGAIARRGRLLEGRAVDAA